VLFTSHMMIQHTNAIRDGFRANLKAQVMAKSLMRIMTRVFSVALRHDEKKLKNTLRTITQVFDGKLKDATPFLQSIYDIQIQCPALDFVLSQETAGYEEHSETNRKWAERLDKAMEIVGTAVTGGAGMAAGAVGGPAAGAAASQVAGVATKLLAAITSGLLKRDNAIYEFRRNIRAAWVAGYQGMLLNKDGQYVDAKTCSLLASEMLQLVYWFITLEAEPYERYVQRIDHCAVENEDFFHIKLNDYAQYEPLMVVLARRIGWNYTPSNLKDTLKEANEGIKDGLKEGYKGAKEILKGGGTTDK